MERVNAGPVSQAYRVRSDRGASFNADISVTCEQISFIMKTFIFAVKVSAV